jgi:hypothetical protein
MYLHHMSYNYSSDAPKPLTTRAAYFMQLCFTVTATDKWVKLKEDVENAYDQI